MNSHSKISSDEWAKIQSQVEAAPVIYSLTSASARQLVLTGTFQSQYGLETEPLTLNQLEPLVESMMSGMPIGRSCAFYYRNEHSKPMVVLARNVVGDTEMCPLRADDPQLLRLLGITEQ